MRLLQIDPRPVTSLIKELGKSWRTRWQLLGSKDAEINVSVGFDWLVCFAVLWMLELTC